MNVLDATEIAYKNGYKKGKADAMRDSDVVEVRHGEWDAWDNEWIGAVYRCSVCKEEFVTTDGTPEANLWNYCPNCGAKMDGGKTE